MQYDTCPTSTGVFYEIHIISGVHALMSDKHTRNGVHNPVKKC